MRISSLLFSLMSLSLSFNSASASPSWIVDVEAAFLRLASAHLLNKEARGRATDRWYAVKIN